VTYQDWRHEFDGLLLQQREKFDSVLILEKERCQKVRAENSRLNEDIERVNSKLFGMIRENEDLQKEVRRSMH